MTEQMECFAVKDKKRNNDFQKNASWWAWAARCREHSPTSPCLIYQGLISDRYAEKCYFDCSFHLLLHCPHLSLFLANSWTIIMTSNWSSHYIFTIYLWLSYTHQYLTEAYKRLIHTEMRHSSLGKTPKRTKTRKSEFWCSIWCNCEVT